MNIVRQSGKSVLFVMAIDAEYGDELRRRFQPLFTGVGPVEAGVACSAALAELSAAEALPDLVVSLGSAGSRTLEQTAIFQARSVSHRDMDASALGFEKGLTPFLGLPAELELPHQVPGIESVRLSSGGNVVSGAAYDAIDADMVDMETYAVLRAAMRFEVPLVSLRGISDGAAELRHVDDWTEYLHVIDTKLAGAVDRLMQAISSGEIAL